MIACTFVIYMQLDRHDPNYERNYSFMILKLTNISIDLNEFFPFKKMKDVFFLRFYSFCFLTCRENVYRNIV